ncbi:hypothetical protein CR513_26097, partial [Mucuna pruriens]
MDSQWVSPVQVVPKKFGMTVIKNQHDELKLPIIIANNLHSEQEDKLLHVLRQHKKAIGWKLSNLLDINPSISAHKAIAKKAESDHPRRGQERSDKTACCRDHLPHHGQPVVPKKSKMTVMKNQHDKLVPMRIQNSWPQLPIIIANNLHSEQEDKLLHVLRQHKKAIGWKLSNLPSINPFICMHRILMEEEARPIRKHQRMLNLIILDVVKKEVTKLLAAGIIYPITDSQWVSPVQVVPKKSRMTVMRNQHNDWQVCIDYKRLNQATRKDHFPFPFIDQFFLKVESVSDNKVQNLVPTRSDSSTRENSESDSNSIRTDSISVNRSRPQQLKDEIMSADLVPNPNQVSQSNSKATNDNSSSLPRSIELKPLPSHLKHTYLDTKQQLPIIIVNNLHSEQEDKLLQVLRQHGKAIG